MNGRRNISNLVYSDRRKPVAWIGSSRRDLRAFPRAARRRAGALLLRVQLGLPHLDVKPMAAIGEGVMEIRVHGTGEFRVVYVTKYLEAIYVLHAFEKRSQRTRQGDIQLARSRFRLVERSRHRA
ncbi:MAG: type II toxin-antitoxin system RelE/ParE family toxin [Vicinamibacterales bacterium]